MVSLLCSICHAVFVVESLACSLCGGGFVKLAAEYV